MAAEASAAVDPFIKTTGPQRLLTIYVQAQAAVSRDLSGAASSSVGRVGVERMGVVVMVPPLDVVRAHQAVA